MAPARARRDEVLAGERGERRLQQREHVHDVRHAGRLSDEALEDRVELRDDAVERRLEAQLAVGELGVTVSSAGSAYGSECTHSAGSTESSSSGSSTRG